MELTKPERDLLDDMLTRHYYNMRDDAGLHRDTFDTFTSLSEKLNNPERRSVYETRNADQNWTEAPQVISIGPDPSTLGPTRPNNPWNNNPCHGIWIRKRTHAVKTYGDQTYHEGERYYSVAGDYDQVHDTVTLHPYSETIHDAKRQHLNVGLKPKFVYERFDFLGHGS